MIEKWKDLGLGGSFELLAYAIFVLMVASLPLIFIPQAVDSFVLPKEAIFQFGTLLITGLLVGAAFCGRPFRFPLYPVTGAFLLFVFWHGVTILWADAPRLAIEETWRHAVVFLLMICGGAMLHDQRDRLLILLYATLAGTTLLSIWTLTMDFISAFSPESLRIRAVLGDWRDYLSTVGMGNTSHLGDVLVLGFLGFFGSAFLVRSKHRKAIVLVALFLHAAALIVAWSVHSNLSLIIGVLVFFWAMRSQWYWRPIKRYLPLALIAIVGWLVVVSFYVIDHPANPHGSDVWAEKAEEAYQIRGMEIPDEGFDGGIFHQAFASPRWIAGGQTRFAIWLITLDIIRQHPMLGTGAGTFTYVYPATISPIVLENEELRQYSGSWTNAAHNAVLQYWSEVGILGPVFLLLLFGLTIKVITDRLNRFPTFGNAVILSSIFAMLAAQAVQMQMNFPLQLPVSFMTFALLLIAPSLLPARGAEETAMMMPVERDYGPVTLGVVMKNMAYPTEIRLRANSLLPGGACVAGGIVALSLFAFVAYTCLTPLRADIAYRPVREVRDPMRNGMVDPGPVIPKAREALEIWPHHYDCRKALQEMLFLTEQYDEVVAQTPKILEKLNAIEIYIFHARALEALNRVEEADDYWDEVFRRRPMVGQNYPTPYRRWVERLEAEDQTS